MAPSGIPSSTTTNTATVSFLANRWRAIDTAALVPAFRLMARGRPVRAREIAQSARIDEARVVRALDHRQIGCDPSGRLVELFGISIASGPFRLRFEGGRVFACCALVSLMAPRLLERRVEIEARDPVTDEVIRLGVARNGMLDTDRMRPIASLVDGDARARDVGEAFCRHVRLLASSAAASRFQAMDRRRRIVTLEELARVAREADEAVWRSPRV